MKEQYFVTCENHMKFKFESVNKNYRNIAMLILWLFLCYDSAGVRNGVVARHKTFTTRPFT